MVKKIVKFSLYVLFFLAAVLFFIPKVSLYYLAEKELKKYDVVVSNERVDDRGFTLSINSANVYVKSIKSANIVEINIKPFLLYNGVNVKNITLADTAKSFVPLKIEQLNIEYSLFNPLNITANAKGEFGELEISVQVVERRVHLELQPSKLMLKSYQNTLRQLKKTENGGYVYDKVL